MKLATLKNLQTFCKKVDTENFFTIDLLKQQIQTEFNKKTENLDQDDPFYLSIYEAHSRKLEEDFRSCRDVFKT